MDGAKRADAILRATRSLGDATLRVAYLRDVLQTLDVSDLAPALDIVCARAEQAESLAREVLVALVDAVNAAGSERVLGLLREEAAGASLLALERLLRHPASPSTRPVADPDATSAPIPDYGRGRPLTLGERKALARRPDRGVLERLLSDPHPDVIFRVLRNPRLTEDDVLRLAAKRPCRSDVLAQIAREPRWAHRGRVRLALALNPDTPLEIAAAMAGLLVRQELKLVATSTTVSPAVRALCLEHLERRPPMETAEVIEIDDAQLH